MTKHERESKLKPTAEFQELTPEEQAAAEARNAIAQFDLLVDLISAAVASEGHFRLRPSVLGRLNAQAVQGLIASPGALRTDGIEILGSSHEPPNWEDVPELLEEMCDYVNDNWSSRSPLHLAAYVMWRLNWIHPYADGNGRTSRAASYLVLCASSGYLLPGEVTIPELIAANKRQYYRALEAADQANAAGQLDLSEMEQLLQGYLATQLMRVVDKASGKQVDPPSPPGGAWELD